MSARSNTCTNNDGFEFTALSEAKNYRTALLQDFKMFLQGNVVEVGAGIGQITSGLREMREIRNLTSIEPDAISCARIRNLFPDHDLVQGTIADLKSKNSWNAILSINVLEHIETDEEELATYHSLLRPEHGTLCLFVPARPEIYAPVDRHFGHFRRYTCAELRHKLEHAGFKILRLRYYNFIGYFAWWATFCCLNKRSFNVGAVRLFDRAIFPLVHWTESNISAPPIGQSLIAVATAR